MLDAQAVFGFERCLALVEPACGAGPLALRHISNMMRRRRASSVKLAVYVGEQLQRANCEVLGDACDAQLMHVPARDLDLLDCDLIFAQA